MSQARGLFHRTLASTSSMMRLNGCSALSSTNLFHDHHQIYKKCTKNSVLDYNRNQRAIKTCFLESSLFPFFFLDNGCPQKKCLEAIFSIIETTYNGYFFVSKTIDKVLSLSKFWRHLANVKIVKITHLNGHISYK